ncbi:epidermal growth factor receptor pathway substrate 15 isoform X2 [Arctopsyche grandis]|uniref:epidermal growth factor receptor pathway substrate 15 isoform X2 n=1 Tax=Arctopsyche grandis TaxID=121162 RepID=UPI00406D7BC0
MAALPSPTQVAGTHSAIYEAYYHQVDPNGTGAIQALEAARFLKKSKLSDVILSKVWDLSDPSGKGFLDKGGLFVALKLVALAQSGKEIAMSNINSETPPPKLGELPKVPPMVPPPPASDWSMKPAERDKYNQLFESLQPVNGLIPGNKVKGVLMDSKLPLPTLGKIWDLADQDKDGMLDRHEFIVAMHLVYKALEKHAIPAILPAELRPPPSGLPVRPPSRPPSRPASPSPARPPPPMTHPITPLPPKPPLPINGSMSQQPLIPGLSGPTTILPPEIPATKPWVVSVAEKQQYDTLFIKADVDMDGFVSGMEIKDTFLQSGLPQPCLAHIWGLCDWDSSGKLSCDQFALAMWMVQRKLRGIEPPAALAPEMIPPSARGGASVQQSTKEKEISLGPQPTPEMEALARDMEQLARERLSLESEVTNKEQSIRVKTNEANSLQSELDTLAATLKQLENQKGEAQKRLNDLQAQVEKLRLQANTQESGVKNAESEAAARKEAAQGLKKQEQQLEVELKQENIKIDKLNDELQQSVLAISQANSKITHLEEQERQATEAVAAVVGALAGGMAPAQQYLSLAPPLSPTHLTRMVQGTTPSNMDASSDGDAFGNMNGGFSSDPFTQEDPFGSKPAPNDPFAAAFPANKSNDGFASDPFASSCGGSTPDPFGGDSFESTKDNKTRLDDNKDAFGCDPFAILHAPTRDGSSPTPSLPPKKHKQPPPRPAPPRPQQPAQAGAFNADFSSFNKL